MPGTASHGSDPSTKFLESPKMWESAPVPGVHGLWSILCWEFAATVVLLCHHPVPVPPAPSPAPLLPHPWQWQRWEQQKVKLCREEITAPVFSLFNFFIFFSLQRNDSVFLEGIAAPKNPGTNSARLQPGLSRAVLGPWWESRILTPGCLSQL